MCIFTGNSDCIFFLRVMPLLNLEIWPKLNILLKQFVNATPLKVPNRKSWNVVIVYIHWKYWFDFFLNELSELWLKHTISCNLYETSLACSHIIIEWRRSCWGRYLFGSEHPNVKQMWQLLINYVCPIITNIRLWFSFRLPITNAWHYHSLCAALSRKCWSVGYVCLLTFSFIVKDYVFHIKFWFLWHGSEGVEGGVLIYWENDVYFVYS